MSSHINNIIEDEDEYDILDITDQFWKLIYDVNRLSYDEIKETTPYQLVKAYIDFDVRYRFYVPEYDQTLEFETIQELFDDVSRFYRIYLPETQKSIELDRAMSIIYSYIETENELDAISNRLDNFPFK